jgi:hypothetical protein
MSTALALPLPATSSFSGFSRNGLTSGSSDAPETDAVSWKAADFWLVVDAMAFSSICAGVGASAEEPAVPPVSSAPQAESASAPAINRPATGAARNFEANR